MTKFSEAERGALKDRAKELKGASTESELLAKIAAMPEADREIAGRLHEVVTAASPDLMPKLWYGMPAYYRNGKMVCFFQPASKFKARYGMFGFSDNAALDDGNMWPCYYAVATLDADVETRIAALVKQAVN